MISGFIGLAVGFMLLMLAPGNFVRLSNDIGMKESAFDHMAIMWISLIFRIFSGSIFGRGIVGSGNFRLLNRIILILAWLPGLQE